MFKDSDLPVTIANGTYRLTKTLGKGGMAIVYAAVVDLDTFDYALVICHHEAQRGETRAMREQRRDERYEAWVKKPRAELVSLCRQHRLPFPDQGKAAVKIMMPHLEQTERFRAEWESLLAIAHPNLVQVYGGGHDRERDLHYYAMELLEGIISTKKVNDLPLVDKLSIIRQAAQGLDCLHGRGIVHRDIKPGNIVCTQSPLGLSAKVADLGIAKDTNRTQQLTVTDQVMGTPYYMAPEQAEGAKLATHLSDVYSLGATLYYLLCGQAPYQGQSLFEVMGQLARGTGPLPIRKVSGGNTPEALEVLVERMMALDPTNRPPGMSHVVAAIDRILELEGAEMGDARTIVELKPRGRAAREARTQIEALLGGPPRGRRKSRGGAWAVVLAVLVLAFAGGFAAGPGRQYVAKWVGLETQGSGSEVVAVGSARGSEKPGSGSLAPLALGSGSGSAGSGSGSEAPLALGSGSGSAGSGSGSGSGSEAPLALGSGSGSAGSGSGSAAMPDPLAARREAFEDAMMGLHDRVKALVAADDFDGALDQFQPLFGEAAALGQTSMLADARARVEEERARRAAELIGQFEQELPLHIPLAAKLLPVLAKVDPDPTRVRERAAKVEAAMKEYEAAMGTAAELAKRKEAMERELAKVEELVAQDALVPARAALASLADGAKAVGLADAHAVAVVRLARTIATRADALAGQARHALVSDPTTAGPIIARLRELAPEHPGLAKLESVHAAATAFLATLEKTQRQAHELFADDRHSDALTLVSALRPSAEAVGSGAALEAAIAAIALARNDRAAALAKDVDSTLAKDPVAAIAALARLERLAPDYADLPVLRARHGERLIADLKKTLADLTVNATQKDRYAEAVSTLERIGDLARAAANTALATSCDAKLKSLIQTRDVRIDDFVVELSDAVDAKKPAEAARALGALRAVYPGHPALAEWREKVEAAKLVPFALAKRTPDSLAVRALGGTVALVGGALEVDAASLPVELEWRVAELATGRWVLALEVVGRIGGAIEVSGQGWTSHLWVAADGARAGAPVRTELRRWTHMGGPAVVWIAIPAGCSLVIRSAELRKQD